MVDFSEVIKYGNEKNSGTEYKNSLLKKSILVRLAETGGVTISEIAKELGISVPTATKLLSEMKEDGVLEESGKMETAGGRRPSMFVLRPTAYYFLGADVRRRRIDLVLLDFQGKTVYQKDEIPYVLEDSRQAFEKVCREIEAFIQESGVSKEKIVGLGMSLTGRVDARNGYSYTFFNFGDKPLTDIIQQKIGIPAYIENDSRAMMYAEKNFGVVENEQNVLFLNLSRGVGVGAMFDGKLYYGKTGFAGELGHIPLFDNETLCHCGKKGCLETEASGIALEHLFAERLKGGESSVLSGVWQEGKEILLYDIVKAANRGDILAITLIAEIADKLGRGVGTLINLLNPDLVVVGGSFSLCGNFLMLPLQVSVNKYSLALISRDTKFKLSLLGENASRLGVAMLIRGKMLGAE